MTKKPDKKQLRFDFDSLSAEGKSFVAIANRARRKMQSNWRGLMAVPPASLLDDVLREFETGTNIPLEIPFFTTLQMVAGWLCEREVRIDVQEAIVDPDIWTIILASSGAGKTWTQKSIQGAVPIKEIPATGAVSSAALFGVLAKQPRGIWIRDEFLQLVKKMETDGGPMGEAKDYFLRLFDGQNLTRETKREGVITIENPALVMLGFNVLETFLNNVEGDSVADGFLQRFGYVIAKSDPNRKMVDFPIWQVNRDRWPSKWESIAKKVIHKTYNATEDGIEKFRELFSRLANFDVPESFYRRVLWRAHKYALVYHIIRGQGEDKNIGVEDYGWAARVIEMQMSDASEVLEGAGASDLEKVIKSCESAILKAVEADPAFVPNPRFLLQRVKALKTSATAKFVFQHLLS